MISSQYLEKIKKEVEEFFKKTTLDAKIELSLLKDNTVFLKLKSEEPKVLIGEKGETLLELQHLLRIFLKKKIKIEDPFYLEVDINDYKKKKAVYLKELARSAAQEAILAKKEKILPPMPAYERKIIHLELSENPNIVTESIGQGSERRVVIKPSL